MSEIDGLVAFSILMENNDGILGKSPDYIQEKLRDVYEVKVIQRVC